MTPHPETEALVRELREHMQVNEEMTFLSPPEFWEKVRVAKGESFAVAIALLNFLVEHGQYRRPA